jgi:hypothetical protein
MAVAMTLRFEIFPSDLAATAAFYTPVLGSFTGVLTRYLIWRLSQRHERRIDNVASIDPSIGVQLGPSARLAEPVHAQRHRWLAGYRTEKGERVTRAIEHGH